jgi:uncharacterized damage-inducible protein DinB
MSVAQMLLPEFDNEMKTTRRVLERVPEDRMGWQPHEKSMTLGRLASHLAELAGWGAYTLENDSLNLSPPEGPPFKPFDSKSRQEVLDVFDANVKKTRAALEQATDDAAFGKPWTLQFGERVIFTQPRGAVLRTMLFSHVIHHRGQLSVYLRLNDVPVPSIYGPSADEQ